MQSATIQSIQIVSASLVFFVCVSSSREEKIGNFMRMSFSPIVQYYDIAYAWLAIDPSIARQWMSLGSCATGIYLSNFVFNVSFFKWICRSIRWFLFECLWFVALWFIVYGLMWLKLTDPECWTKKTEFHSKIEMRMQLDPLALCSALTSETIGCNSSKRDE